MIIQRQISDFMECAMLCNWILVKFFPLVLAKVQLTMYLATALTPVLTGVLAGFIIFDGNVEISDFLA